MQTKNFVVLSFVAIVAVSVLTSYLGVVYLQNQFLLAPNEGDLLATIGSNVNLYVETNTNGKDSVINFGQVVPGSTVNTDEDPLTPNDEPHVLRSGSNIIINAYLKASNNIIPNAVFKTSVAPPGPIDKAGYRTIDGAQDCKIVNDCYTSTSCPTTAPCNVPIAPVEILLITGLNPDKTAFVHYELGVPTLASPGSYSTTATYTGVAA